MVKKSESLELVLVSYLKLKILDKLKKPGVILNSLTLEFLLQVGKGLVTPSLVGVWSPNPYYNIEHSSGIRLLKKLEKVRTLIKSWHLIIEENIIIS